jgi:hypothetical protein
LIGTPDNDLGVLQAVVDAVNNSPSTVTSIIPYNLNPAVVQRNELAVMVFNQLTETGLKAIDLGRFRKFMARRTLDENPNGTTNHYVEDARVLAAGRGELYPKALTETTISCQVEEDCVKAAGQLQWKCENNECLYDESGLQAS